MTTDVIGTNNLTPGVMTAPSTLLTDATTNTQLKIQQGSGAPGTQVAFRVVDPDGTTIFECPFDSSGPIAYNMRLGANKLFGKFVCLNGIQSPPCVEVGGTSAAAPGQRWWSSTGAPSSTTIGTASVGDLCFRRDTPSTANQRLYVCTVAGSPGTWVGIA